MIPLNPALQELIREALYLSLLRITIIYSQDATIPCEIRSYTSLLCSVCVLTRLPFKDEP